MNAGRKPARVYVNGKWLAQQQSGTQRYATEIMRRVAASPGAHRVHLIVPRDAQLPPWTQAFRVHRSRLRGMAFEQMALPLRTFGRHLYSMAGPAPILKRNQTVVMHDAMPFRHPETFRRLFVAWYRVMYRALALRARRIVTVSEFSRRELLELLGVPPERIVVAPCGSDHIVDIDAATSFTVPFPSREYALLVGNQAPHKNIIATAEALAAAEIPTVVVGGTVSHVFRSQPTMRDGRPLYLGRIPDGVLALLYANAGVLVHPSSYEGFGIPVVEAGRFGCPSVIADGSALTEIAGFGGVAFPQLDHAGCVRAVATVLRDRPLRDQLGALAAERAAQFDWSGAAHIIFGNADVGLEHRHRKVLHVTETFSAGTGIAITNFAGQVRSHGVDNHLAASDRGSGLVAELGEGSPFVSTRVADPGLFALARTVLREVRTIRPDVLHVHSSIAGALVRLLSCIWPLPPVVYSPHCFAFERADVSPARRAAFELVERVLARRTAAYVCVSAHEADLAKTLYSGAFVAKVLNFSGPGGHAAGEAGTRDDVGPAGPSTDGGLVSVGRITTQKDPAEFARIVAAVRRRHPDLCATWIGGGDEAARVALESEGVLVTGWRPYSDVPTELRRHRVYVHTARWEAGCPIALFDAMRAEVPIVVRRHASYRDLLPDEWMFATTDEAALLVEELLSEEARAVRVEAQRKLLALLDGHRPGAVLADAYEHVGRWNAR